MSINVCLINMKGGVGKTTLTAQLALSASRDGIRTLAIDLDPQANLSQTLLGGHKYLELLHSNQPSVVQILDDYLPSSKMSKSPKELDAKDELTVKIKNNLDLITSRLELSGVLYETKPNPKLLARTLAKLESKYDLILIDCAPTDSILTQTAFHASRYVIIPVRIEYLATIGLPLIHKSIELFRNQFSDHYLEILGVVLFETYYQNTKKEAPERKASEKEIRCDAKRFDWPIFKNRIRFSKSYARAARYSSPIANTPNVRNDVHNEFEKLYVEFLKLAGVNGKEGAK